MKMLDNGEQASLAQLISAKPYRKKPFGKSSLMGALRRTGTAMYRSRQRSSSMRITGPITPSETSVSRCEGSVA